MSDSKPAGSADRAAADKRDLLSRRLRGARAALDAERAKATREGGIERREEAGRAPLSLAQERLWFLERLIPGTPLYNVGRALALEGSLDRAALAEALRRVVARHEVWRTGFVELEEAGEALPVQRIEEDVALPLPVVDLSALPQGERDREAARLATASARRPFDVRRPPLLRALLLATAAERHRLVLTVHHLVFDGWSLGVLLRELSQAYRSLVDDTTADGTTAELPELPIQYGDFAAWERATLRAADDDGGVGWWSERLADLPPLDLPTDRPRGGERSLRAEAVDFALPADEVDRLRETALAARGSLYMVLLAGWAVLLARYTGGERFAVGTPVAGRGEKETEGLIGFFVNTLALPLDASGDPTAAQLVERVRDGVFAALEHQEVPLARVVAALAPERSLAHSPLFQTSFALQNAPLGDLDLPGVRLTDLSVVHRGAGDQDLNLSLEETADGGLGGFLLFDPALFDRATAERLLGHYRRLLSALAGAPERRLSELAMLDEGELTHLTRELPGETSGYPRDATLASMLRATVA
ncbi:MAG TPA: condensation domain-containing protein, partial [Thermoanaerobaculia bacterium]|nr:condensation domain-containing protein [Thermoanaerobaculia bacterium]